ncbi:hypothetical protein GOV08_01990 [Candidatus Woesearchaeota archaeon]|nr:hypothetical protein [Candidatus Woesearchaeota archaeon]
MTKLTLIRGDDKAKGFLEEGATIVEFLHNIFISGIVFEDSDDNPFSVYDRKPIAVNSGNTKGDYRYVSFIGNLEDDEVVYRLDALADEKILIKSDKSTIGFDINIKEMSSNNGFCELVYNGTFENIVNEFTLERYNKFTYFPERLEGKDLEFTLNAHKELSNLLQEQRRKNLNSQAREICKFYDG